MTKFLNISVDDTLGGNSASDEVVSSQKALKTYIDSHSGGGSQFKLFHYDWFDYELNDQSWLKADTFSWQSGTVYSNAYNHLVSDNSSGTTQTETVGSYTITYKLASDGHKITTDETTVANIYNESGVAWYYVLDTANTRFKLPRSSHGNIVEKYKSGTEWYKVYSDGWCEQGGRFSSADNSDTQVNFLKSFADTNYTPIVGQQFGSNGGAMYRTFNVYQINTGSIVVHNATNGTNTCIWEARGYIASVPSNSPFKYLFFYVGQFSQSATEQTAGLNSSLFNGKVDLDGHNATFPHIVETYQNGTDWYRIWSDGWCEQGGYVSSGTAPKTVNLLKGMADTNYRVLLQQANNGGGNPQHYSTVVTGMTTATITVNQFSNYFFPYFWEVKGYI